MADQNRRKFITQAGATVAVIPIIAASRFAYADDTPMVDEADPQAIALKYVAESTIDGQNCAGCVLYQADASAESGPCGLFPGKLVAGPGWCSAWVARG